MRKLSLLAALAFVSGVVFAQDAPAVKRNVTVYMDAISGDVVTPQSSSSTSGDLTTYTDGRSLWQGNEFEIGLRYAQNWAKVPWLTTQFTVKFGINPVWAWDTANLPSTVGRVNNQPASWMRGEVLLGLTKYFTLYIDTRLMFGFNVQWMWNKGNHGIMLQAGLELFAGNGSVGGDIWETRRNSGTRTTSRPTGTIGGGLMGVTTGPIIDAFWIDFVWNAKMPMGFANSLLIRPVAFGGDNPLEALEGMYIRIQETLSWSKDGFSVYLRLRYNIKNIAFPSYTVTPGGADRWNKSIYHDLTLRAGISYTYDFSK